MRRRHRDDGLDRLAKTSARRALPLLRILGRCLRTGSTGRSTRARKCRRPNAPSRRTALSFKLSGRSGCSTSAPRSVGLKAHAVEYRPASARGAAGRFQRRISAVDLHAGHDRAGARAFQSRGVLFDSGARRLETLEGVQAVRGAGHALHGQGSPPTTLTSAWTPKGLRPKS